MKEMNRTDALNEMIALLETKQALELALLKEQFHITYDSIKPLNIIKNTLKEVTSTPDIKDSLINNIIGLATGYLSRKVIIGDSDNPFRKILGLLLQLFMAGIVVRHADTIKTVGNNIIQFLIDYINGFNQDNKEEPQELPKDM